MANPTTPTGTTKTPKSSQVSGADNATTQQATTTGIPLTGGIVQASWLKDLLDIFGLNTSSGLVDLTERVGLVIFGALLILVGIFLLFGKTAVSLVIPQARAPQANANRMSQSYRRSEIVHGGTTTRRSEIHHYTHKAVSDTGDKADSDTGDKVDAAVEG